MSVATMNIKDPEVRELAAELARRRRTTLTDAVRQALSEAIEGDNARREGLAERLMEIGRRAATKPGRFLTDRDLYDELGLPK